jgi:hypothetical protein
LLAFTESHNDPDESYHSDSSDEEVYKKLYIKLMEVNQKNVLELNLLKTEKNTFIGKIKGLKISWLRHRYS